MLLVHGFPQSSYMWESVVRAAANAGRRAVAPDLPGNGDSPPDSPGTWERHVEAIELYRSGDFEKLRPYEGQVALMDVPALILWGANDPTVPIAAARRFEHEIRDSEVVILEDASHFLYDDEPERCAREVAVFLSRHE